MSFQDTKPSMGKRLEGTLPLTEHMKNWPLELELWPKRKSHERTNSQLQFHKRRSLHFV